MRTKLDHLVWSTPDLDTLVADVTRRTRMAPVEGGSHAGRGTRNYLLGLGNGGYLELIGPDPGQPEPSTPRPFALDTLERPRLTGWAVHTRDIDSTVTAARGDGYDPGTPERMTRTRSDGTHLEWLLTPPTGGLGGVVPFVIDWLDCEHPSASLSAVELVSLTLHHPEPDRVRRALEALRVHSTEIQVQAGSAPALTAVINGPAGQMAIA